MQTRSSLPVVFLTGFAALAAPLAAQFRAPAAPAAPMSGGMRIGGMPMTAPPVPHPALGNQPLFDTSGKRAPQPAPGAGAPMGAGPVYGPPAPGPDPAASGKKVEGKDLKKAVKKVAALHWESKLDEALAQAAATGKPVLWLQALGDIDGFAWSALQSLRGVTLPNEDVMDLLADRFVVGFHDIEKDAHVGLSHGYRPNQCAVGTTNGAGGRNVQMVVLDADGTVLHVLPGFWHAQDLIAELQLALDVQKLHADANLTATQKRDLFASLHRVFLNRHLDESLPRSEWQNFDRQAEFDRAATEPRDTLASRSPMEIKPMLQLVHERLQAQPFSQFAAFDMERFVDYGRAFYDNNQVLDKGKTFQRAAKTNEQREREQWLEREKAEKAAAVEAAKAAKAAKSGKGAKASRTVSS